MVHGTLKKKEDRIVEYLKETKTNLVYTTKKDDGKEAITNYKVLKENTISSSEHSKYAMTEIEKLFDNLLNLIQTDEVLNLYKRLGEYYYKINKELVIDYYNIYNEMYLEDDEKILIKL